MEQKVTSRVEDIFFLSPENVLDLFGGNTKHLETIRKNKVIFEGYRNFDRPNEIWVDQSVVTKRRNSSSKLLNGIACSNGLVEGEAFVARSVGDVEKMPEGMIMVTKFGDPSWTVYFAKIIGLITETGGILSHGAVISRDCGTPAILAVQDALKLIKTGDKIRMNGSDGSIEILN